MRLSYDNIINKHKNTACIAALHGPSLNPYRQEIQRLQKEKNILRLSVNEWYDHFDSKPDYWIVSNSEFAIKDSIIRNRLWSERKYVHDAFNKFNIPLLYNTTADLTDLDFVDKHLQCDYMPYDTKHFKGDSCMEILKNFKRYYEENKNLNFSYYGNNTKLWVQPNVQGFPLWKQKLYGRIGGGWDLSGKCCNTIGNITLQEKLQQHSGHSQHMGTGQTVGLFVIAMAILMGCNPIYVVGLDLDCSAGHADGKTTLGAYNEGHIDHWKIIFKDFLLDDMRILDESAKNLGIEIVNLNKNSWHDIFEKGDLNL
tara:strand:- start:4614 stop:5549 length:936 start_codon:yes stop_codon:yes gene_type:complete